MTRIVIMVGRCDRVGNCDRVVIVTVWYGDSYVLVVIVLVIVTV